MKQYIILLAAGLSCLNTSIALADGLDITVEQGYAPISGYLQTPSGGKPGTSSIKRPTFGELDADDTNYTDFDFQYQKGKYIPYIGLRFMTVDSSGVLEKDLITRGQTLLKGESYDHETSFNIYRAGVKYDLEYLTPKVEWALMDFSYELETPTVSVKRAYTKSSVRIGVEKVFKFDKLDLEFETAGSIPLSNTPQIFTVGTKLRYWFTDSLNVGVGVQYFYLDYEDNQRLSNHLRLEMKPAVGISLQYRF
jgi:hypothetical protein